MDVPSKFRAYRCGEYFGSETLTEGYWRESDQLWLILPRKDIAESADRTFLVVGRPGVDGIEFGYRRELDGFWARYPIENRFDYLARDIDEFLREWNGGNIQI